MDAAFGLITSRPPSRTRILAVPCLCSAWHAADGSVSGTSQRVIRQLVHPHIVDNILAREMRERIDFQAAVDYLHRWQAGTRASVKSLAPGNPRIEALKSGMKWKCFADMAASIRI